MWTLNSEYFVPETIDNKGYSYSLWQFPFPEGFSDILKLYPIYFAFNIKLRPNEDIQELNIKIFKEDITKVKTDSFIPTELLLRVEWSNEAPAQDATRIHAQPHWHIHSYKIIDFSTQFPTQDPKTTLELLDLEPVNQKISSIMEDEDEIGETTEDTGKGEQDSNHIPPFKFHLSMLSDWHYKKGSKHNNILTEDVLEMWLPQCLNYIKEQLEYVLERMPTSL